jgi:hypothetical protein
MRRFGLLIISLVFATCLFDIDIVRADSLTWNIRSEHPNSIAVEFYSEDGSTSWPGDGEVYLIDDSDDHSYPLQCEAGETICYGAWVMGDEASFWGVGKGGGEACEDCCYVCGDGETPMQVVSE